MTKTLIQPSISEEIFGAKVSITEMYSYPKSLIAFAGKRVIQATLKEDLSPDFQTAEFVERHGFVDKVINRKDITEEIGKLLEILLKKNSDVNSELSNETSTNIEQPTKAAS